MLIWILCKSPNPSSSLAQFCLHAFQGAKSNDENFLTTQNSLRFFFNARMCILFSQIFRKKTAILVRCIWLCKSATENWLSKLFFLPHSSSSYLRRSFKSKQKNYSVFLKYVFLKLKTWKHVCVLISPIHTSAASTKLHPVI